MFSAQKNLAYFRRRVLEDWRGLPSEPPGNEQWKHSTDALKSLVARLGLKDRVDEDSLRLMWADLVGEFLATHSQPDSLRQGTLIIRVLQPSVRYELEREWKSRVLARLQERFGKSRIRKIEFR